MFKPLKEQLGPMKISDKRRDLVVYSSNASSSKGKISQVVFPSSPSDVHMLLLYAKRNKLNLIPRGAGTSLNKRHIPEGSIVVDLSRMNKLRVDGELAKVEPGVVLDDLNNSSKLFLPIIPPAHKVCTIGGMIAANARWTKTLAYGKMEDWVEELFVMDGSAKQIKVKKDKIKDFCGKEGMTGIILGAKVRLIKRPPTGSLSILSFDNITSLMEEAHMLMDDNIRSLEYLDPFCSRVLELGNKYHLIIEFEDAEKGTIVGEEVTAFWKIYETLYYKVSSVGFTNVETPPVSLGNMAQYLQWLSKNNIPSFGHLGSEMIYSMFHKGSALINEMAYYVYNLEKISPAPLDGLNKLFVDLNYIKLIKELKEKYDPIRIMNKGVISDEL